MEQSQATATSEWPSGGTTALEADRAGRAAQARMGKGRPGS